MVRLLGLLLLPLCTICLRPWLPIWVTLLLSLLCLGWGISVLTLSPFAYREPMPPAEYDRHVGGVFVGYLAGSIGAAMTVLAFQRDPVVGWSALLLNTLFAMVVTWGIPKRGDPQSDLTDIADEYFLVTTRKPVIWRVVEE